MSISQRIERVLELKGDLVELVLELKREGISQREIYDSLEVVLEAVEAQGRKADEDYLMDVADRVWGFCAPEYRFFDSSLSNDKFA